MTEQGQMWPKYLPLATLPYNTISSPDLGNYSPNELMFGRKPKLLLDLEADLDIKISGSYKDYLHEILQQFRSKKLAMINKD